MTISEDRSRIEIHTRKLAGLSALRKLSVLVRSIENEDRENAIFVKRALLSLILALLYPLPTFIFLNAIFGKAIWMLPKSRWFFLGFILGWLIVCYIPFHWKKDGKKKHNPSIK